MIWIKSKIFKKWKDFMKRKHPGHKLPNALKQT